ncbi:MAG: hypothetical protein ACYCXU_10135 [Thermoleophilia bacterium]|nr:hypothetical protein [Actinomycetota bacterium]MDA8167296.1 hypothetical protein [Actinomycetota bacterium]
MAERIDRELPPLPEGACVYLFKDTAKYRTAREIWLCTKDDRFSELSRKKGEDCLKGKWCDR